MNFANSVKTGLRNAINFKGRATRSEFWWFYLFFVVTTVFSIVLDALIFGWNNFEDGPFGVVIFVGLFVPMIAVTYRRLHDTGRSAWWVVGGFLGFPVTLLLMFISMFESMSSPDSIEILLILYLAAIFIYALTMLIFLCQDSHADDNRYGPSSKYNSGVSVFN